jgi:thiol-disulfide isomerase/thioredoxin
MKWTYFVIPLVIVAGLTGLWWWHSQASFPRTPVAGTQIAAITGPALLEQVKTLNSPLVLVNFWASWCAPCKAEFPHLLAAREKWADRGLKVIFVSIDEPGDLPAANEFLQQSGVQFLTYYKGEQNVGFIKDLYPAWQGAVPTSLLFGPDLKLLDAWEGDTTAAELDQRITKQMQGT